jgi:hypothetical protein
MEAPAVHQGAPQRAPLQRGDVGANYARQRSGPQAALKAVIASDSEAIWQIRGAEPDCHGLRRRNDKWRSKPTMRTPINAEFVGPASCRDAIERIEGRNQRGAQPAAAS